jgi:PPIC-type PPIASE domain
MNGVFQRLLREPLVHFLLLGLIIFMAFGIMGGNRRVESRRIVIDDGVAADIAQRYASSWQRPPTPEEMRALLDGYIEEEVLYREGVAQGLLENDPVIRRRVRQKLDVLAEEASQEDLPTDAELEAWLKAHAARYAAPPVLSFSQVMFNPARLGAGTGAAMEAGKARLAASADPATLGEVTLLPARLNRVAIDQLARDFGEEFADAVTRLPVGGWQGPVRSGYGLHLVRVTYRQAGRPAALAEVRREVERDWESDRRERAAKSYYDGLRRDYDIEVKAKLPAAARPSAAAS